MFNSVQHVKLTAGIYAKDPLFSFSYLKLKADPLPNLRVTHRCRDIPTVGNSVASYMQSMARGARRSSWPTADTIDLDSRFTELLQSRMNLVVVDKYVGVDMLTGGVV